MKHLQEAMGNSKPAHFVRLVVGVNEWTFQGDLVTGDTLLEKLQAVPDRPNTALQLAIDNDNVTYGQMNRARSLAMQMVRELGFKYLTEIGEHPLGSKAGDEPPATQPSDAK